MNQKDIIEELRGISFKHVVSLGSFCSVAGNIEKMGLRNYSGPFDWCCSSWRGVYKMISTNFKDFFKKENIEQSNTDSCIYADRLNHIISFHDYSRYEGFDVQYDSVMKKYARRIENFYNNSKESTLFIRYIWDGECDGTHTDELKFIEESYDSITKLIKSWNDNNRIIFIANDNVKSDILPIFFVKKDSGDTVNRNPLYGNRELCDFLMNMHFDNKENNLKIYADKQKKRNALSYKIKDRINYFIKENFVGRYKYNKTFEQSIYKL